MRERGRVSFAADGDEGEGRFMYHGYFSHTALLLSVWVGWLPSCARGGRGGRSVIDNQLLRMGFGFTSDDRDSYYCNILHEVYLVYM